MVWNKPYQPSNNQRLDPEFYTSTGRICFITIKAYKNQKPFTKYRLNKMILDTLQDDQATKKMIIYTFCLMPDHLHFLISPKEDGVSVLTYTEQFKGKTTNRSWSCGWEGKLWQHRYFDHIVRKEEDLAKISQYIIENAVRKEYVDYAEEWQWSGIMNPLPLST